MKKPAIKYPPYIELSVQLSDGSVESSVKIPSDCTEAERAELTMAWLKLIESGVKIATQKE